MKASVAGAFATPLAVAAYRERGRLSLALTATSARSERVTSTASEGTSVIPRPADTSPSFAVHSPMTYHRAPERRGRESGVEAEGVLAFLFTLRAGSSFAGGCSPMRQERSQPSAPSSPTARTRTTLDREAALA